MSGATTVPSLGYAVLLAVLQGITEFLPVSSSGHLAATQLVWPEMAFPGITLEAALHVGTTSAVLLYYRRKLSWLLHGLIRTPQVDRGLTPRQWAGYIVLGSVPTAAIGFAGEDFFRRAFDSLGIIAACLAATGLVLMSTRWVERGERDITPLIALAIGTIQGAAILPGVSRSGVTISLAILLGIAARQAVTFSFLLSIPAILGAAAIDALRQLGGPPSPSVLFVNIGFATLCAGAIGYVCIGLVHRATRDRWWHRFAWYCWALAAVLAWLAR